MEDSGSLAQFPPDSFDLVVSRGVLEHVYRNIAPSLLQENCRILSLGVGRYTALT